jgi:hypothetical protein
MKCSLPLAAGLCIALFACNNSSPYNNEEQAKDITYLADSVRDVYNNGSSAAAVENKSDTVHKFVRTADIKFKVNNVENTTYEIEDVIRSHGGFVTLTQLQSNTDNVSTVAISKDSSIERTSYTVTNSITFRVPNTALDTTLKDIAKLVSYLDYRVIKADDVSLQLYANRLQQRRSDQHAQRLMQAIDKGNKKLDNVSLAEGVAEEKESTRDEAMLSGLSLNDQVKYSTVQLAIYQHQNVKIAMLANNKEIPAYKPPFAEKLWTALASGLEILETIVIGLIQLWPLLILAITGLAMYKRYTLKMRK